MRVTVSPLETYFRGDAAEMVGIRNGKGHSLDVLKNPSQTEVNAFAGREIKEFRMFVDGGGNSYLWDADSAMLRVVSG